MRRLAFHRVHWPSGKFAVMQTVEVDFCGYYRLHYSLKEETPATEWVGGVCMLLPDGIMPQAGDTIAALQHKVCVSELHDAALGVWKAVGMPVDSSIYVPVRKWSRVV